MDFLLQCPQNILHLWNVFVLETIWSSVKILSDLVWSLDPAEAVIWAHCSCWAHWNTKTTDAWSFHQFLSVTCITTVYMWMTCVKSSPCIDMRVVKTGQVFFNEPGHVLAQWNFRSWTRPPLIKLASVVLDPARP